MNQSCQEIPLQSIEPEAAAEQEFLIQKVDWTGGRLWCNQTEEDPDEGDLSEGYEEQHNTVENTTKQITVSVEGGSSNAEAQKLVTGPTLNKSKTIEVDPIIAEQLDLGESGGGKEQLDPGDTLGDEEQNADKRVETLENNEVITNNNNVDQPKANEDKLMMHKSTKNQIATTEQQKDMEDDTSSKGRDLDAESTCQNFRNVARQGDISPRFMEKGKSAGRGRKKQVEEVPNVQPTGVQTRRTGDFNVIRDEEEKFGGFPVSLNEVDDFRHCKDTCKLTDLGFKGSIFTWLNGRAEEDCIFKRLDRCFSNTEWQQMWPGMEITHLPKIGFDHCPLLITNNPNVVQIKKSFRFLSSWTKHDTFKVVVKENWQSDFHANPFVLFNHKLRKLKKALSTWSRSTYVDIFQQISSLEEVVSVHEAQFEIKPTVQDRERLQKVQAELFRYLALEEQFWKQKSWMTWFNEGDRNTKFFHAHVNGKRKRLQLKRIQNSEGNWIEDDEAMAEEEVKFFQKQFHEESIPTDFEIIQHVPNMITREQNQNLTRLPTEEEVKLAVFGLNGDSAGGPDGFNGQFFHNCWDIVGEDVVAMAGFVKGRSIVENVLLKQEIVTYIRLRTKASPNVIIKLEMTKAYDRLSWIFLAKVMRRMGFDERFIGIVFGTISNNWYSVLINGQPHGFFKSTRGVKQGDPLSPALFINVAEALSRGLNTLHQNLYFCGYGLPKWSPKINHLAYADDTIIFSSSDETSLHLITQVLSAYEAASGQLINTAKSAVYLHHLTAEEVMRKVERATGIGRQEFTFTYLGCPIFYTKRKLEYYQGLINNVIDKIQSWKGKLLSIGGRAVLISHVLQSMPIHLLSAINAPAFVISRIHKLMARFFLSNSVDGRSRH
ncbi:PREDICTED: uncharacterized protein LOC109212408 [Nicotiana attenuata]|uniref:uncharacterized protein LOC109212408 n=1 Tax=Nicotiana attenuata TaxID=49451 RepID=UPI0009059DFA|nr:PREDICTED: uncharacterized protein LOC109212408 [Nicotiana attenuata]